ncbi:cysteine desulfurase family protein [Candidatus Omnitrophota bacterium]
MATNKTPIYLDYNATTPLHPDVFRAMEPFFKDKYGNASSQHRKGREAEAALEDSRAIIGNALGTESVDIVFTSGGTESDNLAIKGLCLRNKREGAHIITSTIEHPAVLETCKFLEKELGFNVTYIGVNEHGLINPANVENALTDKTILVTIIHANNEIGTIQPIKEISQIIREYNSACCSITANRKPQTANRVLFHTDAVQSFGKVSIDVRELGVDLLSISGHKIYGPKGVGALYIRKGIEIIPHTHGGHHERGLRAGTDNVPGIVGLGRAVEILNKNYHSRERIRGLRDRLERSLLEEISDSRLNGDIETRLFNTSNIGFKGLEGEALLINLDMEGIYISTGSACTSRSITQSHVLEAMGVDEDYIKGSVRFSLGESNTDKDIDYCVRKIPPLIKHLRKASKTSSDK